MRKKVLVVDLDGTLFSINTFLYFIRFLLFYGLRKFHVIFFLQICYIVFLRAIKVTSHAKMKYSILKLTTNRDVDYKRFVVLINNKKRDNLFDKNDFDLRILATAAPKCYAEIIAKNEMFDVCLATDFPVISFDKTFENIKEVKKDNVMKYLSNKGINVIDVFITDHIDDLPLMRQSKKNILVAPNSKTINKLKLNHVPFEVKA